MKKRTLLTNHVDPVSALFIDYEGTDKRRKKKYLWIESTPLMGDRLAMQTISPQTGKPNKVQYTSYATLVCLYRDAKERLRSKRYYFKDEDAAFNKKEFTRLLSEIDPQQLNDTQLFNIRLDIMTSFKADTFRELNDLRGPLRDHFIKWRNDILYFLRCCPFQYLNNYPDLFSYQNPDQA